MQTQFAFLADYAELATGNKVSALGLGIDRINAKRFPSIHGVITYVAKIRVDAEDREGSLISLTFGRHGAPTEEREVLMTEPLPDSEVTVVDEMLGFRSHTITLQLIGLRLGEPGLFTFELRADDVLLNELPLVLVAQDAIRSRPQTRPPSESETRKSRQG